MAIRYYCRHCQVKVGEIDRDSVESNLLGFQLLDKDERLDMVNYQHNGDIHVKTICEDCQEALERNPNLHELNTFIQ